MNQFFTTERKIYVIAELKSWAVAILILIITYFSLNLVKKSPDNFIAFLFGILLIKAGDFLTQYRISRITIDNQNKQLTLTLNSLMSGNKSKVYDLFQIKADLQKITGWKFIANTSILLNLYVNSREHFRISGRYGFSEATLRKIDSEIKRSQI